MEYNRISACTTAKEIWDRLILTHEGTDQVKETRINLLVQQYEAFKMKPDESISEMYDRLNTIINSLALLGKNYTNA
ncbi:hypothetical protein MLD38_004981 [Melastoma candidum]|uniref:Uncharacterized protein n=1 Tax=Melastoma candidum TaxID=119954 RepID=A0ACB9SG14_9MYRT|nr:hypothetical protein MLD38_004981 [Melastoma candidum]